MKSRSASILLFCALLTAVFWLFVDDSYSSLTTLSTRLKGQRVKNEELQKRVTNLRKEVIGIQSNDRILEKTARNELLLARPDELVFIFDDK